MPNLIEERDAAVAAARAIVDGAKSANRDNLTTDETAKVKQHLSDADALTVKIDSAIERAAMLKSLAEIPAGSVMFTETGTTSGLIPDGVGRKAYEQLRTGGNASFELPGRKTITSPTALPVGAPFVGGIYAKAASFIDLFPHRMITGPTVRYYRTSTNATVAAATAEGAIKPDAGMVLGAVDATVTKVAAIQKLSEELLADYPDFVTNVSREVALAVKVRESAIFVAQLLATAGLQVSTPAVGVSLIDAVADAVATSQGFGINPTAVVASPLDVAKIRKSKASTSGSYFIDPLLNGPGTLFGLPVYSDPSLALNTVLIGDFTNAGWVGVRDGLRVDIGFDADDWARNLRTVRVEERLLLAVTTPSMITKITLS